jgi:phosphoserine phosphatase
MEKGTSFSSSCGYFMPISRKASPHALLALNQQMSQTILLHFSGPDHPGLTSELTRILADARACVLDIGQAVVHETLALGLLIELPADADFAPLKTALLEKSQSLGLHARFTSIDNRALDHWLATQGKDRFLITVLGRAISADALSQVSAIIAAHNLNIDRIQRLSGRLSLAIHTPDANACIEIRASGDIRAEKNMRASGAVRDEDAMRAKFVALAQQLPIDIAFQRESLFRRNRRLFAFDMDSTLIQGEVIDELAKLAGVADQVVKITESAMRGEIEFQQSFRRRVALLKDLPESRVHELIEKIPLAEGAERLIATLKTLGYKTAILSGGFTFFAHHLQRRFGIDYVHANELEFANGKVTGEVTGPIVDGPRKAALLKQITEQEKISLEQVIAVGDGANDLPMLNLAGMGIAFRAKPLVRQSAGHSLTQLGLDGLLYLIGVRDRDLTMSS